MIACLTPSPGRSAPNAARTPRFAIEASSGPHGSVEPKGRVLVAAEEELTLTFHPEAGYVVDKVAVDAAEAPAIPLYTFSKVKTSHSLRVTFRRVVPIRPRVLAFLSEIRGLRTLAGQHNKEPNSEPAAATDRVFAIAHLRPALWSGDFLFASGSVEPKNRWAMVYEAKREWQMGAMVHLMFHACPPTQDEPCAWEGGVKSKLTDEEWSDLVRDDGELNAAWKRRLDEIAVYLSYLKDNGVEVLWRPHHEMNQGLFWWGGRPGRGGTARLFEITHDYLVRVKGLTNLISVWDVQDFWTNPESADAIVADIESYRPGDAYFDLIALDPYGTGFPEANYLAALRVAGQKPIAIGECEALPSQEVLSRQTQWAFFLLWPDFISENATSLEPLYASPSVMTLEGMPGWKSR